MAELAPLSVLITADASDLKAELSASQKAIGGFESSVASSTKKTGGLSSSLKGLGGVSRETRARIQNVSWQLQDITTQLAMGTKKSLIMSQQLPQLASSFGAVGAVIGVLAGVGVPLLAAALSGLGDNSKALEDRLDDLSDIMDQMKTPMDILKMSADDLAKKYGFAAAEVRKFAVVQAQIEANEAEKALRQQIDALDGVINKFRSATDEGFKYDTAIRRLSAGYKMTADQAVEFEKILDSFADATTFDQQQASLSQMVDYLTSIGVEVTDLPEALQPTISKMIELTNATLEAKNMMNDLADAAANVEVNMSIPGLEDFTALTLGDINQGKVVPLGGGGSGGGSKADPNAALKRELESLEQSLMTAEELQLDSYQRQQDTLADALAKKLLTIEEYNALMADAEKAHQEKMADINTYAYGTGLQKTGQFMGDMAAALSQGNEEMLRISKAFGAAQALISAWQGAAEALKLPFPANLAAFAQVLATGLGAVSAIQGVSKGGTTSGGGAAAGAAQQPVTSTNVAINLSGGPMYGEDQIRELINQINIAVENGATIRLV